MKKYLLTGFLSKFMRTSVICGRDAHRQSDEGFFKCVFNVLVLMKEYWYSPSYTVLLSFFPQPISIITVLECQHESACYLKGALQGSHTSSLNTWCLEQGVRQSHGRCLLPPQKKRKLHDSCHYTILAMLKLEGDHALFGGIHQKARLNSCVIKISNLWLHAYEGEKLMSKDEYSSEIFEVNK